MTTYSQNPPTVEEMREILFVIRVLEKIANSQNVEVRKAVADAKYCLQGSIASEDDDEAA